RRQRVAVLVRLRLHRRLRRQCQQGRGHQEQQVQRDRRGHQTTSRARGRIIVSTGFLPFGVVSKTACPKSVDRGNSSPCWPPTLDHAAAIRCPARPGSYRAQAQALASSGHVWAGRRSGGRSSNGNQEEFERGKSRDRDMAKNGRSFSEEFKNLASL